MTFRYASTTTVLIVFSQYPVANLGLSCLSHRKCVAKYKKKIAVAELCNKSILQNACGNL